MPDITRIQIADEPERSYKDFPANREFKKRAEDENSGGDNVMIVTIYNFNDAYYCDKSYEEILNAMSTIPVLGILNNGSATTSLGCASLCDYKGTPVPYFNFMVYDGEAPIMLNWLVPDTDRGGYDWDVLSHYLG